ncbi:unnamed protein product [Rotaria sp. Silwood2]|nr:unnamed protein product [Rotaria sp. Silwood2]CAF4267892.1 unnamed protein product [Rotaria sp. Silwood2]
MVGIDARNKHILDTKYICPVCSLILRDPVQLTECGHRQCQTCFNIEQQTTIICRQCQTETLRNKILLDRGFKNDMKSLFIDCSFCQWTGLLNNYQEHLDQSHSDLKCGYCGKQFDSANKFNEHNVLEWQKLFVDYILKDFDCNGRIISAEIGDQYLTEPHQHSVYQESSQLNDRQIDVDSLRVTNAGACNPDTTQSSEVNESLKIVVDNIETLINDEQRLRNILLQIQIRLPILTKEISKVKLSIEESNAFLEAVKCNRNIVNQDLALQENINDFQYVSYDGTFVWKITNFQERMIDAQSERQISIYSPPFYSSPNGYKMRALLYLNGDGNARRTHMSLFFVLMQSEYDAILKFPFNYKVTFCLYDQTPARRHIIDSFRPGIKSNSFQRPRSNMNIGSGIPNFIPLKMIQQEGNPYVQNDTMCIKIMVDFNDIPVILLPYAVSLNPGLPTHVQQTVVKQELNRRFEEQQQHSNEMKEIQLSCEETT